MEHLAESLVDDVLKIIYTQADRVETLTSGAALRKILGRFVNRRVFYEISSRDRAGNVFFSAKNRFVCGSVDVLSRVDLDVTIHDRDNAGHSIEILNPATMRVYEEQAGKSFAVAFVSEFAGGVESRCYLRDDGPDERTTPRRTELESISLPQIFEYLEDLTSADCVGEVTRSLSEFAAMPAGRVRIRQARRP